MKKYTVSVMESSDGCYNGEWRELCTIKATSGKRALILAGSVCSALSATVTRPRKGLTIYETDNIMYAVECLSK